MSSPNLVDAFLELALQNGNAPSDEDVALALEHDILDGGFSLPCGCVVKPICTFPNAPWMKIKAVTTCGSCMWTARSGSWITFDGVEVPKDEFNKAVRAGIKLKLPSLHMDQWRVQTRGLLSKEGDHVIREDGWTERLRPGHLSGERDLG